jgi:hypothetical protein
VPEAAALHLAHLTPNAVITLVVFTHACEMFMGVQPSVEHFRHFFSPYRMAATSSRPGATAQAPTVGGCPFRRPSSKFISMTF